MRLREKHRAEMYDHLDGFVRDADGTWRRACYRCESQNRATIAVWCYGPGRSTPEEDFYCEDCVPSRGCSCNVTEIADGLFREARDEQGRRLPCCEYWYSAEGFDD